MRHTLMIAYRSYSHFALIALAVLAVGCRSSRSDQQTGSAPTARWQQTPLAIDGSDSDWVKPLSWYDPKERLAWTLSNDRENIYIMLSVKDPLEQRKIIDGGLTVWINPQAEKSENGAAGIGFPADIRKSRDKSIMAAARPDLFKDQPTTLDDLTDYSLFGFGKEPISTFPYGESNPEGVEVQIGYNHSGELVYEALIPFRAVFPRSSSGISTHRSIALGFVTEGLPPQPGMQEGGGGPGVSVGGGIGMGSFGSGVGIGLSLGSGAFGRGGGKNNHLYKQGKIWQVMPLARPGPAPHNPPPTHF
ncbi:MAG TPA: hypothetical protein VK563_17320 [Puia sp.]|nr:hypothetical protein [Puia sp.]